MVLAGSNLFPGQGLLNDDGLLKERWDQDGSTLFTDESRVLGVAITTVYTVPAGKVAYVKSVTLSSRGAAGVVSNAIFKDNATNVANMSAVGPNNSVTTTFAAPLKFETNITVQFQVTGGDVTFVGWLEKA